MGTVAFRHRDRRRPRQDRHSLQGHRQANLSSHAAARMGLIKASAPACRLAGAGGTRHYHLVVARVRHQTTIVGGIRPHREDRMSVGNEEDKW